jgi:transposase
VARTYAEVVLEDFDLRGVAQVKEDDGEKASGADLPPAARRMRQWIAPSTLRLAILSACAREGVTVTMRKAAYTTDTCAACGNRQEVGPELVWRCRACGREHDQDFNAARVLLAAAD